MNRKYERYNIIEVHYSEFDIRPHYTDKVVMGSKGLHFPLKERYDWFNFTLEGREANEDCVNVQ